MFFVDVKFCFLKIPIVPLALLNKSFFHFPRIEFWLIQDVPLALFGNFSNLLKGLVFHPVRV